MNNRAEVIEQYGEVGFGSKKREDYYFEVLLYQGDKMVNRLYAQTKSIADNIAEMFMQEQYADYTVAAMQARRDGLNFQD
jgi:hypothetical protein